MLQIRKLRQRRVSDTLGLECKHTDGEAALLTPGKHTGKSGGRGRIKRGTLPRESGDWAVAMCQY